MKTYTVSTTVELLVHADSIAEAEEMATDDMNKYGNVSEAIAVEQTDSKQPNVCIACEG